MNDKKPITEEQKKALIVMSYLSKEEANTVRKVLTHATSVAKILGLTKEEVNSFSTTWAVLDKVRSAARKIAQEEADRKAQEKTKQRLSHADKKHLRMGRS